MGVGLVVACGTSISSIYIGTNCMFRVINNIKYCLRHNLLWRNHLDSERSFISFRKSFIVIFTPSVSLSSVFIS